MTSTLKRAVRTLPMRELTSMAAVPLATVQANLMPSEVLDKRRLRWRKKRLAFTLAALLLLVGFGYAFARQQTGSVSDELAGERARTTALNQRVGTFADLTVLQAQITRIRSQLAGAMSGDLQWSALLDTLNAHAPHGLVVVEVHGTVVDPNSTAQAAPAPTDGLGTNGQSVVGTLELSGTATDYRQVAAFVDELGTVRGIVSVDPGNVAVEQGRATYSISASLTTATLGGRFTPKTAAAPSAAAPTGTSR